MKKNILVIALLCLMSVFFLSSRSSALMVGLSTEELAETSEVVVKGKVVKIKSYWSEDGDTIFTKAHIRIQSIIKGNVIGKNIIAEYEGGEVGDAGIIVSDTPRLKKGEKVILFLKPKKIKSNNVYEIVGDAQGKYTVGNDGIARRYGFCVVNKEDIIDDDNIPVGALINKIKEATK